MDRDPSTARLPGGLLSRLRAGRRSQRPGRPTGDAGSPVPDAAVADRAPAPHDLADLSRLTTALARHGHAVRVSDRTVPGDVPVATARQGRLVLDEIAAVLVRCAGSDQRVSVRVRTEDGHLVVGVQTLPAGERPKPIVLASRDEDAIRRRAESAGGRATVRTTHGGNWIAMARIPLRS
jgi:hypothetical protein